MWPLILTFEIRGQGYNILLFKFYCAIFDKIGQAVQDLSQK